MTLDDPRSVREQYAREDNLRARQALYEEVSGPDAHDVLWQTIAEWGPREVLEVGGGPGELSARMQSELGAHVRFVDVSPGMVELARSRGVDARVGDVQELPFGDGEFDTVVAAWMLYHVSDLDRGLAEIARVLRPGGALIAVTNSLRHLSELWGLMEYSPRFDFNRENGEEHLRRYFAHVERHDMEIAVTVREHAKLVAYQRSMQVETAPLPDHVELPFVTYGRPTIFFATT
jgi:SAM-dependent methyltransferase